MMKNNNVIFFWCFAIILQLCFLLCVCSEKASLRGGSNKINSLKSTSIVKLNTEDKHKLVVDNGIVSVSMARPEGYILGISYNGINNVLDSENKELDRGYFDVVWNQPGEQNLSKSVFQRIHGTNFSVIAADENMVEVSFSRLWTHSMSGKNVPINIDIRYIFRSGNSGFYSYAIFNRPKGMPGIEVDQIRFVFKLDKDRFKYMAISDTRQRNMPAMKDRNTGQVLAYPEAILLTNPINPQFRGEVDDKYQYSCENTDNTVHGWINFDSDQPVGFWMITPSNEFRNGGPIKQDLTSHVGPTTLSMFVSTHYAGKEVTMAFQEGETYKKVFGPVLVYLNSDSSKNDNRTLWSDAVQQLSKEVQSWPYDFPRSKDYFPPNQRGAVFGRLLVQDWYFEEGRYQYANNAYVGLALPGNAGSWQRESKGYQFWTQTDAKGYFKIANVVPGHYNLYGWVSGFIGDYKYNSTITIAPGGVIKLNSLVYNPPRNGPTIWEIGIPDRLTSEFHVPEPYPTLMNKLYTEGKDNFRQYGLWERYTEMYPNDDLIYTVGVNKNKDWFYAHVTRNIENNTYEPTTWQIIFEHQHDLMSGNYTLQLALASAADAYLQVRFNDRSVYPPHFATGHIGRIRGDNCIQRHGIHGLYRLFSIDVPSNLLLKGKNIIYLTQTNADTPFQGVMYDYIRLERPPAT